MILKDNKLNYIAVLTIILLLTGCSVTPKIIPKDNNVQKISEIPKEGINIGDIAPDFELQMEGNIVKLSDYRGKPVFLNFWATWCSYCKIEMPAIEQQFQKGYSVEILAVNVKESPMQVRSFMANNGYTFPAGYDLKGQIATLYMANGLPTSYGIDSSGLIRYKIQGVISNDQIQEWFNNLE